MITFLIASTIAVVATIMVITRYNMIHALLYLVVSFLAIAIVFYVLGAPFMAALEIIVYAGAIVVLIIFVIMMLNLKQESVDQERQWLTPGIYIGPSVLALALFVEIIYMIVSTGDLSTMDRLVDAKAVGLSLYGPYVIGVELCGILLMSGIVGAYHLGRQTKKVVHRFLAPQEE
jgi:NADH-quinone oxidoreductase subunit J